MEHHVTIFDTTLRDGEQSPGAGMTPSDKIRFARQLARLGVDVIEAGFPAASPGDFAAVHAIATEIRSATVCALARMADTDIDRAIAAVRPAARPRIHVFIATSDLHLAAKLRMERDVVLARIDAGVRRAKASGAEVEFSAEDATRSDRAFLAEAYATAIAAGADVLNVPDTVGYAMPEDMAALITYLRTTVPGMAERIVSVHCHDDLGMAVANSLAAVRAGARQVECAVNGIGERAGNAALEEIVMAMRARPDACPWSTRIQSTELMAASRLLTEITGLMVPPNKAVVGANAFAHASGVHQDGVVKNRATYEILDPAAVGLTSNSLVLSKHSGRNALRARLRALGVDVREERFEALFSEFKRVADRHPVIDDAILRTLAV